MFGAKQLLITAAAVAITVTGQELTPNIAQITMPDGEIYHHPKVISRNAEGITIMHDTGAAFWKFVDLPKSIQKEFHYNPKQAAIYRKEMTKRREALADQIAEKNANFNFEKKVVALNLQRYYVQELRLKIQDVQRDLKESKSQYNTAHSEARSDLSAVTNLAESQNQGQYGFNGNNCYGTGCYSYRQGDNSMAFSAEGKLDEDRKKEEDRAESFLFKRDWDEKTLPRLIDEYNLQKKHLAAMEAQMKVLKKQYSAKDFDKKVCQAVNLDYTQLQTRLKQLKDLCDNKLITPDEYIKKKEQLLKDFK